MIKITGLKFKYRTAQQETLNIQDLTINSGERVFLFGPSGSGKTTLLEILAGVLVPTSGKLMIANQDLTNLRPGERDQFRAKHIGYIFQSFNLIPYLNVRENITLPLHLKADKNTTMTEVEQDKKLKHLCSRLGIIDLLDKKASELSVGQQQRVAAARALLGNPELLLADEPTSSLDFDHREKFIQLLFELCHENKITVVFVSHDRSLERLFDRKISLLDINKMAVQL